MKKIIMALCSSIGLSQAKAQQAHAADMQALKELNARFIHNFVTNDTVSHSRIIHNDFVCITSNGQYINRKDYMEGWLHGFDGFTYWDYRDENIKIFGNTALVHSMNKYVVMREGKEVTGTSMYTDVYIRENGEWKCVQAQLSKVDPGNFATDETIVRKYDYRK